ncbi:MAG: 2OG-Fe dioxygenase family protein [Proteobacteria bacterium]|nr:2OG-Fe dioxygenase family protein [Pseudomonadota bacterium]
MAASTKTDKDRSATVMQALEARGFAQVEAADMRAMLEPAGLSDWAGFAQSWDDLGLDRFMADGGRYRRRRFAAFAVAGGQITRKPHQPHYQSRDYNALNGGIARWFEPVTEAIGQHAATTAVLRVCDGLFTGLTPPDLRPERWHVEMHQFRIEARSDQEGAPTPEGLHRDGVDWVLVLLVRRQNVERGETNITDLQRALVSSFTLAEPMDAALVDDSRVFHGVTPIRPLDPARPSFRDVLVVTFRRE